MSRQETPNAKSTGTNRTTGAHRKHRAPADRDRERERERERGRDGERGRAGDRADDRHRAGGRRPHGTLPMQPPGHYEAYLDGLFTYCLSILCEHDAASSALGEALAVAERQRARLRDPALRRPWLYALARWVCLRRLAAGAPAPPRLSEAAAESRRAEIAALAWPEAAGTTPEQREALELAVRHQLLAAEVAHVLGLDPEAARSRLARAACEVERTRTALAVADTGRCPAVRRLAGGTRMVPGTAPRAELVRHVDECEVCRSTAERVVAAGPWPGTATDATAVLALAAADRSAAYAALLHAMDAGLGRTRDATPRFDRRGFPLDFKDRAARRAQLRHRAVTSTVVAAVVAAPVLAIWAAYRAQPLGEGATGGEQPHAAASEPDGFGGVPYQKAGSARPSPRPYATAPASPPPGEPGAPTVAVATALTPSASADPAGAGSLTVTARSSGGTTAVTLTASGGAPVHWSATTRASWLRLSATSGSLRPGASITLTVTVDHTQEPSGPWAATITFSPGAAEVTLRRTSPHSPPPSSSPPTPTSSPSSSPSPSPTPTPPTETPTDSASPSPSPTGT
ncbi:BACON domain-containing protein [Streptomyces sp.]|uniref:BACON domain-containing protein n=1 Tax=Streptomyces sp. TaxID=1931 RepID=UPI002F3ECA28